MTIKVMLVDDSATVRKVLSSLLNKNNDIEVIATAHDPIFAMRKMEKKMPDVMILDIEMPRMDGLTFLKQIMDKNPIPVIICSTLTQESSATSLEALSFGAVSVVAKPSTNVVNGLSESEKLIIDAVRTAAQVNIKKLSQQVKQVHHPSFIPPKLNADAVLKRHANTVVSADKVVAIGCSTGGTIALEYIFKYLPATAPPIVIVQHMPKAFTAAFAQRINSLSAIKIKEAEDGDIVESGVALIAPGDMHMILTTQRGALQVTVKDGALVSRHKPSVDVLFRSVAQCSGEHALGIIMTGMGDDGAKGLKEMRDSGARTLGQNEASCVVYGMPAVAMNNSAVDRELSLQAIPSAIMTFATKM